MYNVAYVAYLSDNASEKIWIQNFFSICEIEWPHFQLFITHVIHIN